MVFFLYIAAFLAILLGFSLLRLQFKKFKKREVTPKTARWYIIKYLLSDTFLITMVIVLITFIIPSLIWTTGTKEDRINDIIIDTVPIDPISDSDKKIYIKESSKDGEKIYIVNGDKTSSSFNVDSTEIIEGTSVKNPEYRVVNQYKIKQLKGDSIITKNINDMYANIYLNKEKGTLVGTKVKIYVPKNSIQKE